MGSGLWRPARFAEYAAEDAMLSHIAAAIAFGDLPNGGGAQTEQTHGVSNTCARAHRGVRIPLDEPLWLGFRASPARRGSCTSTWFE